MNKYVVMVTGANGFLGQHVIKHLQLYGESVKEIRVLDVTVFKQKLEYATRKPLVVHMGSITDRAAVRKACDGADIIIHLASIIDWSLFPDWGTLHEVNVKGTEIVIDACQRQNVPYLIYCSSSAVYIGPEEVVGGNETTIKKPSRYYFEAYATTKSKAQEIVLSADNTDLRNGNKLRTISIVPLAMYGELDYMTVPLSIRPFKGRTYPLVGKMTAILQYSYVGNTAMMFVNAAETFPRNPSIGGNFFFSADDSPPDTLPHIMTPFLQLVGSKASWWYIPYWCVMIVLFLFYCILSVLRIFKRVDLPNLHFTFGSIAFLNTTFYVTYDKATSLLGYKPLYSYNVAIERSNKFYSSII